MATAAILEVVYVAKARTLKGLTIFKTENSNFVIFKYMWFPWQRRPSWNWYMLQNHGLLMVIICVKFECKMSNRFREN
jgi:hypothetical protein